MNTLSSWILSVIISIAPGSGKPSKFETEAEMKARFEATAIDMAEAIRLSNPLFKGKDAELKTAALVTAVAYFEGGFMKDVDEGKLRGDGGSSWCHMQLHIGSGHVMLGTDEMKTWTGKDLIKDRVKCFRAGIEVLRSSMATCQKYGPDMLSQYTTGRCTVGQREARHRWEKFEKIYKGFPYKKEINAPEKLSERATLNRKV